MKRVFQSVLFIACIAWLSSCSKEKLEYTKMPKNGNVNFNCGDGPSK